MKKTFICALLSATAVMGSAAENLIVNPGFEEGSIRAVSVIVPGWKVRDLTDVFKYHKIAKENAHSGERCALILVPEDASAKTTCYFQTVKSIELEGGKPYRFSCWAKNLSGKAFVRLVQYTSAGKYWDSKQINIPADAENKEWKQYSANIKMKNAGKLTVMVMKTGPGELYLDDFVVEEAVQNK